MPSRAVLEACSTCSLATIQSPGRAYAETNKLKLRIEAAGCELEIGKRQPISLNEAAALFVNFINLNDQIQNAVTKLIQFCRSDPAKITRFGELFVYITATCLLRSRYKNESDASAERYFELHEECIIQAHEIKADRHQVLAEKQ